MLVVFHHAREIEPWLFNPAALVGAGARGVDVFFVISGFVMFTAARGDAAGRFLARRVLRVGPLYWLATALVVVIDVALKSKPILPLELVKSLLFIPYNNPAHGGEIWPRLVQGWTLNFEMFFYVLFALAILSRRVVPTTTVAIIGLIAAGMTVRSANPLWQTYTSPLMIEFLGGVLIGAAYTHYGFARLAVLLPIGIALILASDSMHSVVVPKAAIPASLVIIGALACETRGWVFHSPFAKLVGDASYSIYLFHTFAIGGVKRFVQMLPVGGWLQFLLVVGLSLAASIFVGIVIHRLIEKPLLRRLMRLVGRTERPPVAAQ